MDPDDSKVTQQKQAITPKLSILAGVLIAGLFFLFFTVWCIQNLWNTTFPDLFKIREITYFETLRLVVLIHLLFGSHQIWKSKN
jgi:hypothetical protein